MIEFFESFLPENWQANESSVITYRHSILVANIAKIIAVNAGLDLNKAFLLGLMHDIGKFFVDKSEKYKHPRVGYQLLKGKYPDIARICLTHPFVDFNLGEYIVAYCWQDHEESEKIQKFLTREKTDEYVKLIQLCDKLSSACGYVTLEAKFDWYKSRYEIDEESFQLNLKKLNEIKAQFEKVTGKPIYDLIIFT